MQIHAQQFCDFCSDVELMAVKIAIVLLTLAGLFTILKHEAKRLFSKRDKNGGDADSD